ncbi:hypothetical protein X975_00175, partial [Stegodyphus mimosarum]
MSKQCMVVDLLLASWFCCPKSGCHSILPIHQFLLPEYE